jgi:hypothetical protein
MKTAFWITNFITNLHLPDRQAGHKIKEEPE